MDGSNYISVLAKELETRLTSDNAKLNIIHGSVDVAPIPLGNTATVLVVSGQPRSAENVAMLKLWMRNTGWSGKIWDGKVDLSILIKFLFP